MTADELAAIKKLCDDATPGPWVSGAVCGRCHIAEHEPFKHPGPPACKYDYAIDERMMGIATAEPLSQLIEPADESTWTDADADFIAVSRSAVPALLDEIARLRAGIKSAAAALARDGHDQEDEGDRCLTCETYYDLLQLIGKAKPEASE